MVAKFIGMFFNFFITPRDALITASRVNVFDGTDVPMYAGEKFRDLSKAVDIILGDVPNIRFEHTRESKNICH